ncbi:hypothetical protein [Stenotrophomonas sp.]|uniref:hypothetical protein n=1 Tax=Stenotrophomonas sp. TaxID=69392 RepID=UPI0028983A14|nr:hypothetical protein [Stenotrophomonas sp.]
MSKEFENFVRGASKVAEEQQSFDAEQEKRTWASKLDELHAIVERSLDPFFLDGSISIRPEVVRLSEPHLGSYDAKGARIVLGNMTAQLKPIATFVVGARGRVDLIGPRGRVRIVLVPADTTGFPIRAVSATGPGPTLPPVEEWRWKFTTSPPHVRYVDVDEESFQNALMEVMGTSNG